MTSTNANAAAIAAALAGSGQPTSQSNRRSLTLKGHNNGRGPEATSGRGDVAEPKQSHMNSSGLDETFDDDDRMQDGEAVADGMPRGRSNNGALKARARRASEGAHLSKGEGKRGSGELRCEQCGKGYKHSSCLTKHLSVPCVSFSSLFDTLSAVAVAVPRPACSSRLGIL